MRGPCGHAAEALPGRQTGSEQWRAARGETGSSGGGSAVPAAAKQQQQRCTRYALACDDPQEAGGGSSSTPRDPRRVVGGAVRASGEHPPHETAKRCLNACPLPGIGLRCDGPGVLPSPLLLRLVLWSCLPLTLGPPLWSLGPLSSVQGLRRPFQHKVARFRGRGRGRDCLARVPPPQGGCGGDMPVCRPPAPSICCNPPISRWLMVMR